ncbi:hypothetical protein BWR19_07870 [Halomonas sp. 1513]|nr:DUF3613 domain-containing protein [Halomonas sp. 1513]APX92853.1 hypothetical protein BWR19_07870 [Halomonas sp. 1513]
MSDVKNRRWWRCAGQGMLAGLAGVLLVLPQASAQQPASGDAPAAKPGPRVADHRAPAARGDARQPGDAQAARLLDAQRSGRHASANPQNLSGAAQQRIYRRYLESFSHPIPDTYIDTRFGDR